MVDIIVIRGRSLRFIDKGRSACERVMDIPDKLGIREGLAS
jgi:hypothetical protein